MAGMAIQTQIRHNAEEIRCYFADLKKWEKEMREKSNAGRALRKADRCPSQPREGPAPCQGKQATKAGNEAVSAPQTQSQLVLGCMGVSTMRRPRAASTRS